MTKLCILCNQRPATLPDREKQGRPIKQVCRECHAKRLGDDVAAVMKIEVERRQMQQLRQKVQKAGGNPGEWIPVRYKEGS